MSKVNWKNDGAVLAYFRSENARGRRTLERMGVILSERVVRIAWGNNCEDIFVEVETPFAKVAFVCFDGGAEVGALVLRDRDEACLLGTWRKRGTIVGHSVSWLESKAFAKSSRPIKRGSKKVAKTSPWAAYAAAALGLSPFADMTRGDDVGVARLRKVCDEVEAELSVESARKTLAEAGETAVG